MEKKKINRRSFLGKMSAASSVPILMNALPALAQNIGETQKSIPADKQRNVLLLISDDHGIDQLGCYGNKKIKTPSLDKMAGEGVRFTNAFSVAASCSASRGSILSGLYTHQNGQWGHYHNWHHCSYHSWVESLPMLLKSNGYQTGLVGKLHVGPEEQLPFDFRVASKDIMGNRDVMTMAEKAGDFFNQDKNMPFFLLMGYSDPHREARGMTDMKNVENFSGFANDLTYRDVEKVKYKPENVHVPDFLPDTPEVREELADQYESITRLDSGIGKVVENLRKSGRYDNTLIIYISDNGIPFPGAKTNIYDSGVHLPMIVNSPQVNKGNLVNNDMISWIDLVPTILEWTGTNRPKYSLPGKSFLSTIGKPNSAEGDEVYQSHTFHEITMYYPMRSVRTRKFRYIRNLFPELEYPFATDLYVSKTWQGILERKDDKMGKRSVRSYLNRPAEELFDIVADPAETKNLASDPQYQDVLIELRTKLQEMRLKTEDPWVINDNYDENKKLLQQIN